jgi:hypothetical protein
VVFGTRNGPPLQFTGPLVPLNVPEFGVEPVADVLAARTPPATVSTTALETANFLSLR